MVVIAGIALKAAGALRLWAPVIGVVAGSGAVAIQRVSWRRPRAVDFRAVQGAITVDLMTLFVEMTKPRRSRIEAAFDLSVLPTIREFLGAFASRSGWTPPARRRC